MKPNRPVSKRMRILFPIVAFLLCAFIAPGSITLIGMLCFGNLLKESGVTERLAQTARTAFLDAITIVLGVTVGTSTDASRFLTPASIKIFALGAFSFGDRHRRRRPLRQADERLLASDKINPIIGCAGVSAVPDSARVAQLIAAEEDPQNFVIMHAMAPNVAGVIGSAVAAGVLLATLR